MLARDDRAADLPCHASVRIAAQPPFAKRHEEGWLNLSSNELHHPAFAEIFRTFLDRCGEEAFQARYPHFDVAARQVERRLDLPDHACLLTPGADLAIRAVLEALGSSGRLVCPVPCYRAYTDYAAAFGVDLIGVDALRSDSDAFVDRLVGVIDAASPCLVALADPDGTTGRRLSPDHIGWIARAVARGNSLLVRDEAYLAFAARADLPEVRRDAWTLTIRTLSKSHGTAGLRLALLLGPPPIVDLVARTRVSNGLSRLAVAFLRFVLAEPEPFARMIGDVADWRDDFQDRLRRLRQGRWVAMSGGNFVLFDLGSRDAAEGFAARSAERRIRVRLFPDSRSFASCARVTVAPPPSLDRVTACIP